MNLRLIAVQLGVILKSEVPVNDINRVGSSVLAVNKESFPNNSITSVRAQAVFDWMMSLGTVRIDNDERAKRVVQFSMELAPEKLKAQITEMLERCECPYNILYKDALDEFYKRSFHEEIISHSRKLFIQGNYFHAVFEAAKAYNNAVKEKSVSEKDGQGLMMEVFSLKGVLKMNAGLTETERNVQEGIKFLSSGLMGAVRNPTAHEPALDWAINKQDCLDLLSLISFLFRQLNKAVYFKG
jgi:uncharacterized protein (TIGR02391 family)